MRQASLLLALAAVSLTVGFAAQASKADAAPAPIKAADKLPDANGNMPPKANVLLLRGSTQACLEVHSGNLVSWKVELSFDHRANPFAVVGGSIKGTICDSPSWTVTGGILGADLKLTAKHTGTGSCAGTLTIAGRFQNPPSYTGTYGFDASPTAFKQTSLFLGYGPCTP